MKYQTENGITTLNLTFDRIEENKAILIGEKDEEIIVEKKFLPKEAKEGEYLVVTFSTDEAEARRREQTAKEILNEILNPSQD